MLAFDDVGAGNWERYKEFILNSESIFPENMRSSPEDFSNMFSEDGLVAKVALLDSRYIGNVIGCAVPPEDRSYYEITGLPEGSRVLYILNMVVNPEHHGKGYGKQLLQEMVRQAKNSGYDYVVGHFRQNASFHIMKKMGGVETGNFKNWDDTQEDFIECCLDLRTFNDTSLTAGEPQKSLPAHEQAQPKLQAEDGPAPLSPEFMQPGDAHLDDPSGMAPAPHF